ncbi:LysR family transcriptional regulator [Microvirga guangxiensis]|uniref:DNA-binding transcriptional regulator, LysR family n=1 Tax=Microvirga guangxiensis TaxID=549386 RepID=A0A1G5ATM9_9HYPH|nr:LysR family transcriptional regulator [Microvirga guangxiensis]SCX81267.1 DNA-binding transcriptional regulator, LysR family [Microvirga guangxiensis]
MEVELGWLKDFLAVIDAGGFSRAAEKRNVTQPALSRHIRALEHWLGTSLFERNTHTVVLTRAGAAFRPIAEDILHRVAAGRERVLEEAHAAIESLRFAVTNALSITFFPHWFRQVQAEAATSMNLQLISANMASCERMLIDGEAQFLIAHHHVLAPTRLQASRFQSISIGEDIIVPVSAPDEADALKPRFALPGTTETPLPHLTYHPGSGIGRIVTGSLATKEQPAFLQPGFIGPAVLLAEMAQSSAGIAWVIRSLVEPDLEAGRLVRAGGPEWDISVEVRLFRPRARLTSSAETFWKYASRLSR